MIYFKGFSSLFPPNVISCSVSLTMRSSLKRYFPSSHYFFYLWLHFLLLLSFPNSYLALEMSNVDDTIYQCNWSEGKILLHNSDVRNDAVISHEYAFDCECQKMTSIQHCYSCRQQCPRETLTDLLWILGQPTHRTVPKQLSYAGVRGYRRGLIRISCVSLTVLVNVFFLSLSLHIDNFVSSFQNPRQERK